MFLFKSRAEKEKQALQKTHATLEKMIDEFNKANGLTLDKKIPTYEKLIRKYSDYEDMSAHEMHLVAFYRQASQNDKAWGLLNKMTEDVIKRHGDPKDYAGYAQDMKDIRFAQHEITRDEGRYLESVGFLAVFYLLRSISQARLVYEPHTFVNRAKPIGHKGGLTTDQINEISVKISSAISKRMQEGDFLKWYRQYTKSGE